MNERLAAIRHRRALLQERAARERDEVAHLVQSSMPHLMIADWGLRALRLIRAKPLVIGGAVAAALMLRPERALRWSLHAWAVWQAWQRIRGGRDRTS